VWQPDLDGVEIRYASVEQMDALAHCASQSALETLAPLLVWDETLLERLSELLRALPIDSDAAPLAALVSARTNGSVSCFQQIVVQDVLKDAALQGDRALQILSQKTPLYQAIIQATQLLTRAPDRFSAAQFTPLTEQGLSDEQAFSLLAWSGLCGWLNRLKIGLGEVSQVA
jgi:alkylhydroperoxidase family enzyme